MRGEAKFKMQEDMSERGEDSTVIFQREVLEEGVLLRMTLIAGAVSHVPRPGADFFMRKIA